MLETLAILPFSFWIAISFFAIGIVMSIGKVRNGIGIPMLVVLVTVFVWYVGDVLYNDYQGNHQKLFSESVLDEAWWQVSLFLTGFLFFVLLLNRIFNKNLPQQICHTYRLYRTGVGAPVIQTTINDFFRICLGLWIVIVIFALFNIGGNIFNFIFPFTGERVSPFYRSRIGGGFSAILSLANYLYLLIGSGFGIVVALSMRKRIRLFAFVLVASIWSFFLLDRSRNTMLIVVLPGLLSWVFFRLQVSNWIRIGILFFAFVSISSWFSFIIDVRGQQASVAAIFYKGGLEQVSQARGRHKGLSMYEELCWLTKYINEGRYSPNWGQRYYAEAVNFIPRGLWAGKPTIGIDYAIVRGFSHHMGRSMAGDAGVTTSISTGMIGQGVSNFGLFLGPIFSGFLMAIWVIILARIDTNTKSLARLPLLLIGLVMTFNMGRDITLLILYPFVFGWVIIKYFEKRLQ